MADPTDRLASALSGRYRIERTLGEGGMATVYLARDERHDRDVAVKVLRPELAAMIGAERFLAEIRTTAKLQHPNILPLFDSGEADGFLYYVMPYVRGDTLRDRLERERQLGVDEAVAIAVEVADALGHAHRQGVIHRDIKPANILLQDGRPAVADFGIALALSAAGGGRLTETGLSLGTPHYMSPEQASAERDVTARSDVYSLGCVLYEMLAGQPPHTGPNAQSVLVRILTDDPRPLSELRSTVPPHVSAAVARAVEKLPADRFATAAEFGHALGDTEFRYRVTSRVETPAAASGEADRGGEAGGSDRLRLIAVAEGLVIAGLLAALLKVSGSTGPEPVPPPLRAALGESGVTVFGGVAIAPDEATIVLSGMPEGRGVQNLWVRRSDDFAVRPIAGTEGAVAPRFSPDGRWLAFHDWTDSQSRGGATTIRRVPLGGGPVQDVAVGSSFDWGPDGLIWYAADDGLYRVSPEGGVPERVFANSDSIQAWLPHVLPDGRGVLFNTTVSSGGPIVLLDTGDGSLHRIADRGAGARYVASGHVLFVTLDGTGYAVGFDLEDYEVRGAPVPVLQGLWGPVDGFFALDVSPSGTLVQGTLEDYEPGERLAWVDMEGNETELPLPPLDFEEPEISPDGRSIAYIDFFANRMGLYDLNTGSNRRLPEGITPFGGMGWLSDSRGLYVGGPPIYRLDLEGADTASYDLVSASTVPGILEAVSPDGRWLVLRQSSRERGSDLSLLRLEDGAIVGGPRPYLRADWDEAQARISPDGQWLAYMSTQTGQPEIYVRSFPEPGPELRVSEERGLSPAWARDGPALFYETGDSLVRADLTLGEAPAVRARTALFATAPYESSFDRYAVGQVSRNRYDVHPDGRRLLMVRKDVELGTMPVALEVVTNWFEELRARTGG